MSALRARDLDAAGELAARLDAEDPLRAFRDRFRLPEGVAYLCGNCLGLQPRATGAYLEDVLAGWAQKGFRAHFSPPQNWLSYERDHLTATMADQVGALPVETALMNSLTVNLHLMLVSFYRPAPGRYKILIEEGAFPSDQFVVDSQLRLHGHDPDDAIIRIPRAADTGVLEHAEILSIIEQRGHEIALILLGNTCFRTGQVLDMESVSRAARREGCMVGFDLAHAVGNVELRLHDWGVDFAVWCTYKYLNAGPGSLGGCFVHQRHAEVAPLQRLEGWWGNEPDSRFPGDGRPYFRPQAGASGWQASSPPILAMAALRASLELFAEAGMRRVREKSVRLGEYLQGLLDEHVAGSCRSLTPRDPAQRGCQFTLQVKANPRELQTWLLERGVVCDVKGTDLIRVAPAPLYNGFVDLHRLVRGLKGYFAAHMGRTGHAEKSQEVSLS